MSGGGGGVARRMKFFKTRRSVQKKGVELE